MYCVLPVAFNVEGFFGLRALYEALRGVLSSPSLAAGRIAEEAEVDALVCLRFPRDAPLPRRDKQCGGCKPRD